MAEVRGVEEEDQPGSCIVLQTHILEVALKVGHGGEVWSFSAGKKRHDVSSTR